MDASNFALDTVLIQNQGKDNQPIVYELRKLIMPEQKYPIYKKKFLAIIHAIKI